MHGQQNIKKKN